MLYIDTSILAAYYCPEPLSEAAEKYITASKQPAISQLTEVELVSAVAKKVREKYLSQRDGLQIINAFQSHIDQKLFFRLPVEVKHYQIAKNWIALLYTPLRTLDALHLAVAASCQAEFITADSQLAKSARKLGLKIKLMSASTTSKTKL